jgi:hypothetical protein
MNELRAQFPHWCDLHFESYLSATDSEHDPLSFGDDSVNTFCHGENAINLFIFAETYDMPLLRHDAIDRLVRTIIRPLAHLYAEPWPRAIVWTLRYPKIEETSMICLEIFSQTL